jgi:hypothetical protein
MNGEDNKARFMEVWVYDDGFCNLRTTIGEGYQVKHWENI